MMQRFLQPLTPLYLALTTAERAFFRVLPFLRYRPHARTISVGNLTMGGTGKTPVLLALLEECAATRTVMVLTRGYRSPWERGLYLLHGAGPHPHEMTDDALLVNSAFPKVPVLVGKNRAHAARLGETWFHPDLIFLDDGFQYRRLHRDLDILLWDAAMPAGDAELIPAGRMREPWHRLREAHVIFLTRCEIATDAAQDSWRNILRKHAPGVPLIEIVTQAQGWITPEGNVLPLDQLGQRVHLFSAIARPESFACQVRLTGREIAAHHTQRDHDRFAESTLAALASEARRTGSTLVCTEKDRSKIPPSLCRALGIFSLQISVAPRSGKTFSQALADVGLHL